MANLDISCIISGHDTDGAVSVFEEIVPIDDGPPLHAHRDQLEVFHVIDGAIRFRINGVDSIVSTGDSAFVPKGAAHAFRNVGSAPAVIHFEMLPSGDSEEFFSILANERDTIGDPVLLFDRFGTDLLGPPLDDKPAL